jgi:rubrerythrin
LEILERFFWFVVLIALAALFFSLFSCSGNESRERTLYQGMGQAYVMITAAQSNYTLAGAKAFRDSLPSINALFKAASVMEQIHKNGVINAFSAFDRSDNLSLKKQAELSKEYSLSQYDTISNIRKYFVGQPLIFSMNTSRVNLNSCMKMQSFMINDLFLSLSDEANNVGSEYMKELYFMYMESEQSAYRLFSDAYKYFSNASQFTTKYGVCPKCGSIYIYDDGTTDCGVCGVNSSKFIIVDAD